MIRQLFNKIYKIFKNKINRKTRNNKLNLKNRKNNVVLCEIFQFTTKTKLTLTQILALLITGLTLMNLP